MSLKGENNTCSHFYFEMAMNVKAEVNNTSFMRNNTNEV